ncbi:MAG TPA: metallophosphoesterase [Methylomirabilota bacterium]|nr:metallophosphoesterase [Methylomirabilota bacterium]
MVRLAAVGDVHFGSDSVGLLRTHLDAARGEVDLLLLSGDLTRRGEPAEARVLAAELRALDVPVVAVLGNHDHHGDAGPEVAAILADAGVQLLEGSGTVVELAGVRVGVAGVKGFGGGFAGACATEFGEPEMKLFVATTRRSAESLRRALAALECDLRIALLHYSPVEGTLVGEHPGLWPFLGSYLLAEAVDGAGAHLALHGHAHAGCAAAVTPGGVPVWNVAQPVIRRPFARIDLRPRSPQPALAAHRELKETCEWDSTSTTSPPRS